MNYYLITGLDCGIEIEPFIVEAFSVPWYYLEEHGDISRYYEVLTQAQAEELIKKGMEVY